MKLFIRADSVATGTERKIQCEAKKGDHHAQPLHRLDDNGRRCCRRWRFGVHQGTLAQAPAASVTTPVPELKTPWGEPDLQGIWTDEFDTPLQRPAKYAEQEFFTEAQRAELDKERTEMLNRRVAGTLADAYNFAAFLSTKRTGTRTSKIVDPPNGRIPPLTAEAQKAAAADREFRLALLQATDTCKKVAPGCAGGKYDPTSSPRRAEAPPRYNTANINRYDGPEDGTRTAA